MVLHATPAIGRGLMTRARIDLFFDCISPYTHISLHLWSRYAKAWPVTLKLRPFFLGGVMKATGNQPPGMLATRGSFLAADLQRSAALYDVPLLPSEYEPRPDIENTLRQRLLSRTVHTGLIVIRHTQRSWRSAGQRGHPCCPRIGMTVRPLWSNRTGTP